MYIECIEVDFITSLMNLGSVQLMVISFVSNSLTSATRPTVVRRNHTPLTRLFGPCSFHSGSGVKSPLLCDDKPAMRFLFSLDTSAAYDVSTIARDIEIYHARLPTL